MRIKRRKHAIPDSIKMTSPWHRYVFVVSVVALLTVGIVCERSTRGPIQNDDQSRYHNRTFRVARVIDGDTLDIAISDRDRPVTRIRLWGVDTPETGLGGQPVMHYGKEASAFAEQILAGRDVHVVLSPERTRGKYGRLLAYVFLERVGRMFNEMLLEEGYAYADLRFDHHYYRRFKAIEKRARQSGKGLWADVTLDQMPEWKQRFERIAHRKNGAP